MAPNRFKVASFQYRFEILAVLLTAIIFGGGILPTTLFEVVILPIAIFLLAFVAIVSARDQPRIIRYGFTAFAMLALASMMVRIANHQLREVSIVILFVFILFLATLSFEVFRQMLREKEITRSIIFAAFDCYLLLGVLGAMLFTVILVLDPNAFTEIDPNQNAFDKMIYFSFITLTSIGFGDITPTSVVAEKFTALYGLIGHFYSVVIVGIIVGKYVAARGLPEE